MTVHNIAFQGYFGWEIFHQLYLPDHAPRWRALEYYGGIGFLKAGLPRPTSLTTVSPTYAPRSAPPPTAWGSKACCRRAPRTLHGILNGIDTDDLGSRRTDPALPQRYNSATLAAARRPTAARSNERFGLDDSRRAAVRRRQPADLAEGHGPAGRPSSTISSRAGGKLCVLGSGEAEIENGFAARRCAIRARSASSPATTRSSAT